MKDFLIIVGAVVVGTIVAGKLKTKMPSLA